MRTAWPGDGDDLVELLPASRLALDEYLDFAEPDLTADFLSLGVLAQQVVPDIVALSLCLVEQDLTFTLLDRSLAVLLARAGSDHAGVVGDEPDPPADDVLDEHQWHAVARAASTSGIASTLSFPVLKGRSVVSGITAYASSAGARSSGATTRWPGRSAPGTPAPSPTAT